MGNRLAVEVHDWDGLGFKPLVSERDWAVAILNWEPNLTRSKINQFERHKNSDEVFVLWRGQGALIVCSGAGIELYDMKPGVIYNVTRGTWHTVIATPDASWMIVESRETDKEDTEIRNIESKEISQIKDMLPSWLP